jgi:hypothetical protein
MLVVVVVVLKLPELAELAERVVEAQEQLALLILRQSQEPQTQAVAAEVVKI